MATKRRNIDVVSAKLRFTVDAANQPTFADILRFMDNKDYRLEDKLFEFALINTPLANCILGIIVTTQDKDIPPIRDKQTKQYSAVNINPVTQGLAFANIFLYDTTRNILLYEINRNGCFLKQLKEIIYSKWNAVNEEIRFDLNFPAILRANEYARMLQMNYYKKISIELLNPSELISCFDEDTDSIQNSLIKHNIQVSAKSNANFLKIEQITLQKKLNPLGLSKSMVIGLVDAIKLKIADAGFRNNVQILRIEGYTDDAEDANRVKPIDILADSFNESFKITDIQIQSDVQQSERKEGIERVYNKILPELRQLVG